MTCLFAVVDKVAEPLHRLILRRAVGERNESDSGDGHFYVWFPFKGREVGFVGLVFDNSRTSAEMSPCQILTMSNVVGSL